MDGIQHYIVMQCEVFMLGHQRMALKEALKLMLKSFLNCSKCPNHFSLILRITKFFIGSIQSASDLEPLKCLVRLIGCWLLCNILENIIQKTYRRDDCDSYQTFTFPMSQAFKYHSSSRNALAFMRCLVQVCRIVSYDLESNQTVPGGFEQKNIELPWF